MTDSTSGPLFGTLSADPATAYRELLYRPGSDLARRIDREFAVVARPGCAPESPIRSGDVLLEVELGRPGRGRYATLDDTAADTVVHGRRVPHGRLVLRHRVPATTRGEAPVEPDPVPSDGPEPNDPLDAEFDGTEHKSIGDDGSGHAVTPIMYGDPPRALTFGDVVALAGDYFDNFHELRMLGDTAVGRQELLWTMWHCYTTRRRPLPEPRVGMQHDDAERMKARVKDRYYGLAATNYSHFLWGGLSWPTYSRWHAQALADAYVAGQNHDEPAWQFALAKEAFADHFLTDSFAGGHIRTPRIEIKNYYLATTAGSEPFVRYLAHFLRDRLHYSWGTRVAHGAAAGYVENQIADRVRHIGGHALGAFTLGDIVSLALHDRENGGLSVVTELDEHDQPTHGVPWIAEGDTHLDVGPRATPSADARKTAAVAAAAVRAGLAEMRRVRDAGTRAGAGAAPSPETVRAATGSSRFAAQSYIPRPDANHVVPLPTAGGPPSRLEWHWGRVGDLAYAAIDTAVRTKVSEAVSDLADDLPDVIDHWAGNISGVKSAMREFAAHLHQDGINAIAQAIGSPPR